MQTSLKAAEQRAEKAAAACKAAEQQADKAGEAVKAAEKAADKVNFCCTPPDLELYVLANIIVSSVSTHHLLVLSYFA